MRRQPNLVAGFLSVVWLAFIAVPIYALVFTALRPREGYLAEGMVAIPRNLTLENFATVMEGEFPGILLNTSLVTVGSVGLCLLLSLPIAYAIVRGQSAATQKTFRLFLLGLAVPSQAVIIPVFWIINTIGLYDSLWAIILPTAAFSMPLAVLVLTSGMRDISNELYEAMQLDGASQVRTFAQLAVPLTMSSIATVAVFTALQAWNGFLFPLILTASERSKVVTLGLYSFLGQYSSNVPALFAAVVISTTPVFLLYLFARQTLVSGLMGAGGK